MRTKMTIALSFLLITLAPLARAGVIEDAIQKTDARRIYFSFEAREGVYGDGHNIITRSHDDEDGDWEWNCDCEAGPVRVTLRIDDGEVTDVDTRVGGRWRSENLRGQDLGMIDPLVAAEALIRIAENARHSDVDGAIFAATLAKGFDDWKRMLRIARDRDLPEDVREAAVFWLGQAAATEATRELVALVDDDDAELGIREHAIFSLSQRDADECVPALARVAKTSRHPQLREKALFWLAQHDDPRVIDLFEEILVDR